LARSPNDRPPRTSRPRKDGGKPGSVRPGGAPAVLRKDDRFAGVFIVAGVLGLALAGTWGWGLARDVGMLTEVNDRPLQCRNVTGFQGFTEDVAVDRERGLVFVSQSWLDRAPQPRGQVSVLRLTDLAGAQVEALDATRATPADLRPLGLGLWKGADGARRLFVVSAGTEALGAAVELYGVDADGRLTHVRSVRDPLFVRLNDVVPTGPESFYVTQDGAAPRGSTAALVELANRSGTGRVIEWTGTAARVVADGLVLANGIALSADGRRVFVSETLGRAMRFYARDPATGAFVDDGRIQLPTGLDNLDVDPAGVIWAGAHPRLMTLGEALDPAREGSPIVPSQVLWFDPGTGEGPRRVNEAMSSPDGAPIPGVSVAVRVGNDLLLGSVVSPQLSICPLPADRTPEGTPLPPRP